MERIIIYGKGGIGKSTISSCLSYIYASQGKKVLHIGCDPKHDSTIRLINGQEIITVMDSLQNNQNIQIDQLIKKGILDIHCLECGGPPPGVGCAGRGISRMFEILEEQDFLSKNKFDIIIYDVLGDVVCGGFAAPLRFGFGEKVLIVISEEIMSMYAANKIINVIDQYKYNNIYLAGLVVNKRDNETSNEYIDKFAQDIGTNILSVIPRSKLITEAEYENKTVIEKYPNQNISRLFKQLVEKIDNTKFGVATGIKFLSDQDFNNIFIKDGPIDNKN